MKTINEIQSNPDEDKRLDALKRKSAAAIAAKLDEMAANRHNDDESVTDNNGDQRRTLKAVTDTRDCDTCGDTFTPKRTDSKYCSSKCRQKAYRQRSI